MQTPPPYRCPTCKSTFINPRNLAVFIDGTANKPGPKNSNVMKLFDVTSDGEGSGLKQRKCYFKGISAYSGDHLPLPLRVGKMFYSGFEIAFAWNVEKNVTDAYDWLVKTYEEGDQVYLFGFSRGAYQVRALASMIHEVGLLKEEHKERITQAFRYYVSIDPNNPETKYMAIQFKQRFCWPRARIHFIGVWETLSSLGLIKKDVQIIPSASVTNACHLRHALALDECRVQFMPEYFTKVNLHRSNVERQRSVVSDVKEVWFAGSHSDVGGISRSFIGGVFDTMDYECYRVHAGNVPLLWMSREAAAKGLVIRSDQDVWAPEDVDLGRINPMKFWWRVFEIMPIRHQVSFGGTGKHGWSSHLSRPRLVIPDQQIHFSAFPGNMYTPRATLAHGIDIPTVPQKASIGLWTAELLDEGATMHLTSLLSDQQKTLRHLGEVLLLLHFRIDNGQTQTIPKPLWSEMLTREPSSFDKFALTVIYTVISDFAISPSLEQDARNFLCTILCLPDHPDFPRALYILRFSAWHRELLRRFIAHDQVIRALMLALERIAKSRSKHLFPLAIDSLCYLIDDDDQQTDVINQLTVRLDETEPEKTRLSLALEMKATSHLVASLKMIASCARHQPGLCEGLKVRIIDLAKKGISPASSAAVEVLVALNVPLPRNLHFSTILDYLRNTLPPLDAEVGSTSSPDDTDTLPSVLRINGSGGLDEEVMRKLVRTIESRDVHERTAGTLTLLKLCNNRIIRNFYSQNKVLEIFMRQLEREETSLLAAYSLKMCLRHALWIPRDFPRVAQLIIAMFAKGWFDDAIGRVEGFEIFGGLMASDDLRQQTIDLGIIATLTKKLEGNDRHGVRMSLICLEILGRVNPMELTRIVVDGLTWLRDENQNVQNRGVKVLSALAETQAGERAIRPHMNEIVKMLPSAPGSSPVPHSQSFSVTVLLYELCRNETLRETIQDSNEYADFLRFWNDNTLFQHLSDPTE